MLVRVAASLVSAGTERASSEFASKNLIQKAKARPDLVRDVLSKIQRDGLLQPSHAVRSRLDQPSAPGYSSSGTVVAVVGEGTDIRVGDRVACAGLDMRFMRSMRACRVCWLREIPDDSVSFEEAVSQRWAQLRCMAFALAEVKLGDTVAVIGLGLLGQLTVQMLQAAGCTVLGSNLCLSAPISRCRTGAHAACSSSSEFRDLCHADTPTAQVLIPF